MQYIQISMCVHLNPSHLWLSGARVCVFVLLSRVCQVLVTCASVLGLSIHVVDALPHKVFFFIKEELEILITCRIQIN